jgi:phage terminase large subunit GpA-like protein
MKITATCIDSGNWSKFVYDFTGPRFYRRIFAIKGSSDPRTPIWPRRPARPRDRQSALFLAGVTAAKEITVARFSIEKPGAGYCHFPADREFEYYEQLLSEKPIGKFVKGVPTRLWVKSPSARNEALDCRIYNLCALHALRSFGFNLDRPPPDPAAPRRTMAGYADLGSSYGARKILSRFTAKRGASDPWPGTRRAGCEANARPPLWPEHGRCVRPARQRLRR